MTRHRHWGALIYATFGGTNGFFLANDLHHGWWILAIVNGAGCICSVGAVWCAAETARYRGRREARQELDAAFTRANHFAERWNRTCTGEK